MSVELGKETVRVSQVIGENSTQTVVENDIIVPDTKPDIENIMVLDGDVLVDKTECMQDKVVISGTINYKILYSTDEETKRVKSIETKSDFSYSMNFLNVREGMVCKAGCSVEYMDYSLLNGRKVNIKTILKIDARAQSEENINIVNNISGVENLQVLEDNVDVNVYLGESGSDFNVNESMEIPAGKPSVKEILFMDLKIAGVSYKISEAKVAAEGHLNVSTLYVADNEEENIQLMEHEIPFTQFMDLPGATENTHCNVECKIVDSNVEAVEDNDGELRIINMEAGVAINVEGYARQTFKTIKDAYSPRNILTFENSVFVNEDILAEENKPVNIKELISIENNEPPIDEVYNIICKPVLSDYTLENGSVSVEGVVLNNILYHSNDDNNPICCHKKEIPFTQRFDLTDINKNSNCKIRLDVQHCSYSIVSRGEIELRLIITVNITVTGRKEITLLDLVEENPVDKNILTNQPSIVIYFAQPEDTLWNIAKKYYTTKDSIKSMNNMDNDNIAAGQQIFIPKSMA